VLRISRRSFSIWTTRLPVAACEIFHILISEELGAGVLGPGRRITSEKSGTLESNIAFLGPCVMSLATILLSRPARSSCRCTCSNALSDLSRPARSAVSKIPIVCCSSSPNNVGMLQLVTRNGIDRSNQFKAELNLSRSLSELFGSTRSSWGCREHEEITLIAPGG